jgi:hypothetical protein
VTEGDGDTIAAGLPVGAGEFEGLGLMLGSGLGVGVGVTSGVAVGEGAGLCSAEGVTVGVDSSADATVANPNCPSIINVANIPEINRLFIVFCLSPINCLICGCE